MNEEKKCLSVVSAEIGEGAGDGGCKYGASALLASGITRALALSGRMVDAGPVVISDPIAAHDRMDTVAQFSHELAEAVSRVVRSGSQPLVLGGDHSCAIGTWTGIANALAPRGRVGLIWVDAHLDAHTFETSDSKAPHGMPLAALMGFGTASLTSIYGWTAKIRPSDVAVIGARSYEPAELELLGSLGVRVMFIDEVVERGFGACFVEAMNIVSRNTTGWGLSFDLDGLDPVAAPATGTPVAGGIDFAQAVRALRLCRGDRHFVGMEIAEYNPLKDFGGATAQAVHRLAEAALGSDVAVTEEHGNAQIQLHHDEPNDSTDDASDAYSGMPTMMLNGKVIPRDRAK